MLTEACVPSGCQCYCHRALDGMKVVHAVACCSGLDAANGPEGPSPTDPSPSGVEVSDATSVDRSESGD